MPTNTCFPSGLKIKGARKNIRPPDSERSSRPVAASQKHTRSSYWRVKEEEAIVRPSGEMATLADVDRSPEFRGKIRSAGETARRRCSAVPTRTTPFTELPDCLTVVVDPPRSYSFCTTFTLSGALLTSTHPQSPSSPNRSDPLGAGETRVMQRAWI